MMKQSKIYMRPWLEIHHRTKKTDTDEWYMGLANELLPLVMTFPLYEGNPDVAEDQRRLALTCALYLEDCVADAGNWREFIHWHKKSYGRYLPFYSLTEDYLPDEINREDIAFLLWALSSTSSDSFPFNDVENPLDETLLELADVLYERLDAAFESAPISDELASNWMMDRRLMEKEREPLPEIVPGAALPADVEHFLEAGKGEPLMFFDSYDALKFFFVHSLKWEDDEEALLPELAEFDNFVVYGNPKGVLVAPDVAKYFAAGNNPLYDAATTEEEAYEMFCEGGLCPFDLLKYGMEHNLLPEAQFPFENGKALLHDNWDFVARWFLREFYEGD